MKRAITIKLFAVVLVSMLAVLLTDYRLQIRTAQDNMYQNAVLRIEQMAQILEQNAEDIEQLERNLQEDYLIRAKAAAYLVEKWPAAEQDIEELRKVAALLRVDEIHLFTTEGTIYFGTQPEYYGYHFRSGDQMRFFLPLLYNKRLELCQDITPNTAEGKMMQYTALWREDGQGIVQIGMEPVRLMEAMEKNELPYLFNRMTTEEGLTLWAVDVGTGEILGASDPAFVGRQAQEVGLRLEDSVSDGGGLPAVVDGVRSFCVFQPWSGGVWLGVSRTADSLYRSLPRNMTFSVASLLVISAAIILLILFHIDTHIIQGIATVNKKLERITNGDLDTRVEVDSSPEFSALSEHINQMVGSLLENTNKLSLVFQNVEVPIAAFEYNADMTRVLATSRLGDIFMLAEEETGRLLENRALFEKKLAELCAHPLDGRPGGDVYALPGAAPHFVRLRTYVDGRSTFGVVIDVTEEENERQRIAHERDVDLLTGLASRRAFFTRMDRLFRDPDELGHAAILMTDVDRLKRVNDTYGHEYGDRLLRDAARLLMGCDAPNKVAARLSGDEFILVVYGCTSEEEVLGYLAGVETRMGQAELLLPDGQRFPVRMSGGYVLCPPGGGDYQELLRLADQTMYKVKRGEKGHFARYRR